MTTIFSLFLLTINCEDNVAEPMTLSNTVKTNIENDPIAVRLLESLWENPPNENVVHFLHLVMNDVYLTEQIYGSVIQQNGALVLGVQKNPDVFQFELQLSMASDGQAASLISNRIDLITITVSDLLST